ncbi:hypothetical protein PILCRDRAFT_90044 [Piloderma croceum F 1598]|uniref:Uncharacterized protein n=1 Tax=Piloderma croceum (strain F 1598) TaxID=765440 RepID=A0A0C3FJQ2_PILCF|nr:hypothetical protein PILCRDRAFT_90044 [Piloderma croceum F 1598]
MLDACSKNPLSHTQGDLPGDESQPPRKKTSPNTPGNNPLPPHNRNRTTYNHSSSSTGTNLRPTAKQTQPQQPTQAPSPLPNEPPNQPQDTHPPQMQPPDPTPQQTLEPQEPPPLPSFVSTAKREEMRHFAAEHTQTLARQAATRLASNSDELEITPGPEQGFYRPEGLLSCWTIDNIKTAQVITITSQPRAGVMIHIEGEMSHDPNCAPHLAAGLARELKHIRKPPSMSNLTTPHVMTEVIKFISNAFRTGEMAAAIHTIISKGQAIDTVGDKVIVGQEEVNEIIDKLYIERIDLAKGQNIPQPSINLYLMDTDYNNDECKLLHKATSKTTYIHDLHGVGRYFLGWTCALCHEVTHPTSMCPYLQIEDDIPLSDPIISPHAKARQFTNDRRGGSTHRHNPSNNCSSRSRGGTSRGQR